MSRGVSGVRSGRVLSTKSCLLAAAVLALASCGGGPSVPEGIDLVVSSLSGDTFGDWSATLSLVVTCRNRGKTDSDADTDIRCYFSDDDQLDGGDQLLTTTGALAVDFTGQTDFQFGDSVDLPSGSGEGAYYLIYVIDEDGTVAEEIEDNNILLYPLYVGPKTKPDFQILSLTSPGSSVPYASGEAVDLQVTIRNNGIPHAGSCTTRLYISTSSTIGGGAVAIGDRATANLGYMEQRTISARCTIPSGTATNMYYFLARADADSLIAEENEGNNDATGDHVYIRHTYPGDDAYEVDDLYTFASPITINGSSQHHTSYPYEDNDWVTFTTTTTLNLVIETNGLAGGADTYMFLFHSSDLVNPIAEDDDWLDINSTITLVSLSPGTYYLLVVQDPWGWGAEGGSFDLQITSY